MPKTQNLGHNGNGSARRASTATRSAKRHGLHVQTGSLAPKCEHCKAARGSMALVARSLGK